jgi:hypothetical protein
VVYEERKYSFKIHPKTDPIFYDEIRRLYKRFLGKKAAGGRGKKPNFIGFLHSIRIGSKL